MMSLYTLTRTWAVSLSIVVLATSVCVSQVQAQFYKITVPEHYAKAKRLFDQNKIREARDQWNEILTKRDFELNGTQKKALKDRIHQCDSIIRKRKEASISNMDRAKAEIANAKPLLRATMPLDMARKDDHLQEAINYLNKAKPADKTTTEFYTLMAHCHMNMGFPDKALPFINKALSLNKKHTTALNLKAQYLFVNDDLQGCLSVTKTSIEVESQNNQQAWYWMVKALLEKDDRESFKTAWKYIKRGIGDDETIAEEYSHYISSPKHKKWLADYARNLATSKALKEKQDMQSSGPEVNTIKGGKSTRGGRRSSITPSISSPTRRS